MSQITEIFEANPGLVKMVNKFPFKPYNYLKANGVSDVKLADYFRAEIKEMADKGKIVTVGEPKTGLGLYRRSAFDTEILGLETAKTDLILAKQPLLLGLILELEASFRADGLKYVTYRFNSQDKDVEVALQQSGWDRVDGYSILLREFGEMPKFETDPRITVRQAKQTDIPILQQAIAPTFVYSRFFTDPLITPAAATKMHSEWVANSIYKKVADQVFVADFKGRPVGFITLEIDQDAEKYFGLKIGHIPLIGTDPDFRGRNIGLIMTDFAFKNWFAEKGTKYVRIETQDTNIPAKKTYEKAGFKLVDEELTYRWNDKKQIL